MRSHFSGCQESKQWNTECWKPTCTAWRSSAFLRHWCLMRSVPRTNSGNVVLWMDSYCGKLYESFEAVRLCAGKEWTVLLVSAVWGDCQYCESNRSFLAKPHGWSRCRASPLAATITRSYTTSLFFLFGFLNERVYISNPRSPEDLEHNIEWAVAGTDNKLLEKLPKKKKIFRRVNACLKVWDVFKICCNHMCMPHSWLSLKRNEIKWFKVLSGVLCATLWIYNGQILSF